MYGLYRHYLLHTTLLNFINPALSIKLSKTQLFNIKSVDLDNCFLCKICVFEIQAEECQHAEKLIDVDRSTAFVF